MNSTQIKKGLQIVLSLAVLFLNFGIGGASVAHAAAPINDNFADAKLITGLTFLDTVNTTEATTQNLNQPDSPAADPQPVGPCTGSGNPPKQMNRGNNTVWYRYTPPVAQSISVDTIGSTRVNNPSIDIDTYIAVWTGTENNLSLVTCNDDNNIGRTSQLSFVGTAGITYYIQVASYNCYYPTTGCGVESGGNLVFHAYITNVDVTIGETSQGKYYIASGQNEVLKYNLDGGPVVISGSPGSKIIASLNQWRKRPGTTYWTGVAQSMALPVEKLSNKYVLPRYDGSNSSQLRNSILIANLDGVDRSVTVEIGETAVAETFSVPAASSVYKTYNVAGGPVVVTSDTGAKIIASLYELRRDPTLTGWNGQSEMMGIPWEQLSDQYVLPIYFGAASPATLDARLFIANADAVSRDITVRIGGTTMDTYTLAPNTGQVLKYNLDGGPVVISGPPGSKIIASLNQWRKRPGTTYWTGVAQSMALPVEKLSNKYVLPRYDGSNSSQLRNSILIANLDNVARSVTVEIGGTAVAEIFSVPAASSVYKTYNVAGGPVVVTSDAGAKIIASLYELRRDPTLTGWNGQSEMMGVPWEELSDQYVLPIYFGAASPATLDARLFIAAP